MLTPSSKLGRSSVGPDGGGATTTIADGSFSSGTSIDRHVGADEHGDVGGVAQNDEPGDQLLGRCEPEPGDERGQRVGAVPRELLALVVLLLVRELDRVAELRPRGRDLADVLVTIGE